MSLGQRITQEVAQTLQLLGGATSSIFPQVEVLLTGTIEYQKALEFIGSQKRMSRYQSVMDFLFCELNPEWRLPCRRYYVGNGPQLKEVISVTQLMAYNRQMLKALEIALYFLNEQRLIPWIKFRNQVNKALRVA